MTVNRWKPPWTRTLPELSQAELAEYALRVFGPIGGPIYLRVINESKETP